MMLSVYRVDSADSIDVPNENTFVIFQLSTDDLFYAKVNIGGVTTSVLLGSGGADIDSIYFVPAATSTTLSSTEKILSAVNLTEDLYYLALTALLLATVGSVLVFKANALQEINFPLLAVADKIVINENILLTALDISGLVSVNGIAVQDNDLIVSLDISSLTTIGITGLFITGNATLADVIINAAIVGSDANPIISFSSNNLTVISVDSILAAVDAGGSINGTLTLTGGGNSSPTGGILNANYVSLGLKGWSVTIN